MTIKIIRFVSPICILCKIPVLLHIQANILCVNVQIVMYLFVFFSFGLKTKHS